MNGSSFQFKQFTIYQQQCAMKVGTDGTLLGAWAEIPSGVSAQTVLDIGTGTGLIALMIAQRYTLAEIIAIDIDADAVCQAKKNVRKSPFAKRISVTQCGLQDFDCEKRFDAIVCNPPFFVNSLTCHDNKRTLARHTDSLSYEDLMKGAFRLLQPHGKFSIIIPTEYVKIAEDEGLFAGLMLERICWIRTKSNIPPKRALMAFSKMPLSHPTISTELTINSEEYAKLTKDFYL